MRISLFASSVLLALPLAAFAVGPVHFSDVPADAWYQTYVTQASQLGIVSGYTDAQGNATGTFGPGNNVTIAEALKMTMESSGMMADSMRTDSPYMGHWAQRYADAAAEAHFSLSLMKEQLDWPATRGEMAMIAADAFAANTDAVASESEYTDVSTGRFDFPAISALTEANVMVGDGRATHCTTSVCTKTTFRPDKPLNRAEAVKIVIEARAAWGSGGSHAQPSSASSASRASSASSSSMAAQANTIHYTSAGFTPSTIVIKKGTTLTILNDTSSAIQVDSDPHPTHTSYPMMNALSATPGHGFYTFTFNVEGTYHFHNHLDPSATGTVIVE
jgi:plastocyanin